MNFLIHLFNQKPIVISQETVTFSSTICKSSDLKSSHLYHSSRIFHQHVESMAFKIPVSFIHISLQQGLICHLVDHCTPVITKRGVQVKQYTRYTYSIHT